MTLSIYREETYLIQLKNEEYFLCLEIKKKIRWIDKPPPLI
jgi:hypothetical protein